jgi:type IV secretory pathway TrbF-like protein
MINNKSNARIWRLITIGCLIIDVLLITGIIRLVKDILG